MKLSHAGITNCEMEFHSIRQLACWQSFEVKGFLVLGRMIRKDDCHVWRWQSQHAEGKFIRCYVPELTHVNTKHIHAPWLMSTDEQQRAGCVIGRDYPAPIVDHAQARERTLARYAVVKSTKS